MYLSVLDLKSLPRDLVVIDPKPSWNHVQARSFRETPSVGSPVYSRGAWSKN
jgi:hypothetical protein